MSAPERDRLASLFGALASSADVASGFHSEKAIRTAILARRLAEAHGLDAAQQSDAYYLALVRFLGCTSFSHESALFGGGDDISVGSVMSFVDPGEPARLIGDVVRGVGRGAPPVARVKGVARLLSHPSAALRHAQAECDVGDALARRIGMPESVLTGLGDLFERWDGKGHPHGKSGDESTLLARVVSVADVLELGFTRFGVDSAMDTARKRAGGRFDPDLVATFCAGAPDLFAGFGNGGSVWESYLEAEPAPHAHVTPAVVERYAEAFARAVDLKSVWTASHSHSVGVLAAAAGAVAGLGQSMIDQLRMAGWLHDLGRVAVPNLIWDKPGPLNAPEWEQVRLHAYHTERLLARSPVLAPVATLAGAAHERGDGSGYPKALRTPQLEDGARILAASDVFTALREDRPHRPAMDADTAVAVLRDEAERGALDRAAVRCVLEGAGIRAPVRHDWPAGLTEREVDVIRLVAKGGTNKDVARALGISHRTVQHHVAHIYDKIGVTSRAGAALFAAEQGLTGPGT